MNRLLAQFELSGILATYVLAAHCSGAQVANKSACVNDDGKVAYVGHGVTMPRLLLPSPQDSGPLPSGKGKHLQEMVYFEVIIGSDGQICDVKISRSSTKDTEFNERALTAVKKLKFAPARKKDKPLAVQVILEVNFDLYGKEGRPLLIPRMGK